MSRPRWARRDPRPMVMVLSAAIPAVIVLGVMILAIILGSQGLL